MSGMDRCGVVSMIHPLRSRRDILAQASSGFGLLALAGLMSEIVASETNISGTLGTVAAKSAARAKHVILCFMACGPSHVDTFDARDSSCT